MPTPMPMMEAVLVTKMLMSVTPARKKRAPRVTTRLKMPSMMGRPAAARLPKASSRTRSVIGKVIRSALSRSSFETSWSRLKKAACPPTVTSNSPPAPKGIWRISSPEVSSHSFWSPSRPATR